MKLAPPPPHLGLGEDGRPLLVQDPERGFRSDIRLVAGIGPDVRRRLVGPKHFVESATPRSTGSTFSQADTRTHNSYDQTV